MRIRALHVLVCVLTLFAILAACEPPHPTLPDDPVFLFTRHVMEPIYQEDLPFPEEIGREVAMAATPGEYESASLGVHSRVRLGSARLQISELRGPGSAVIPASSFDIKITRYIEPYERWVRIETHPHPPGFLDPKPAADLLPGTSQQYWLTVHVPDDAAEGRYEGVITLVAEGAEALELPLSLRVYPFALDEAGPSFFLAGDSLPLVEESFIQSRAHGMNTICIKHGWAKQIVPRYRDDAFSYRKDDFERLRAVVSLAQRHGLATDRPIGLGFYSQLTRSVPAALYQAEIPGPDGEKVRSLDYVTGYELLHRKEAAVTEIEHQKGAYYPRIDPYAPPDTKYGTLVFRGWVEAFRAFEAYAREQDWPPTWYWLIDEPHHSRGSMRLAVQMLEAANKAGVDSLVTCNEPTVSEPDPDELWFPALANEKALLLEPWLNIRCYHNRYLGPETRERARAAGDLYGTYINVYGNQPLSSRHLSGYLAWKLDFDTVMIWNFKNVSSEFGDSRAYLRDWEGVREGIDDLRYLERLERALADGLGDDATRTQAKALLEEIAATVEPNVRSVGYVDGVSGKWIPGRNAWPPEEYDTIRSKVAAMISALLGEP